jgi:hypothetical protein
MNNIAVEVSIPRTCWTLDGILHKPIQLGFLGINVNTDGWMRFKIKSYSATMSGEFTSHPVSEFGKTIFGSREECLIAAIKRLLEQLKP